MPTNWQLFLMAMGLVFYVSAAGAAILHVRRPEPWQLAVLRAMLAHGLVANAALLIWRVAALGTIQAISSGFDAMILIALLIALETAGIDLSGRLRGIDAFLLPMAAAFQIGSLLMLGTGQAGDQYRSWFVVGHGIVLALAAAFLVAGGIAGIVYLIMYRMLRRKQVSTLFGQVPSLESLERFGRGAVAAGFPLLTFGMLTGFCKAAQSDEPWRSLQRGGPTIGLWLVYAVALAAIWLRVSFRGPKAAASAAIGSALTVLSFTIYLAWLSHS